MFKKIFDNLLGKNALPVGTGQPLTMEATRSVVYALLEQHGATTTLDVKNELRRLGFQAFQDQVSQLVSALASHDQLSTRNNGRYNVYAYGFDTTETPHVYLESGDAFWEARLDGRVIQVYEGKVGTDGAETAIECYKNLLAVRELERMADEKRQAGFHAAADPRPPLAIRQQYGHLFGIKATSCRIGYFNVIKKEYQADQLLTKNAGYRFTWQLTSSDSTIETVLNQPTWSSRDVRFDHAELLGEKITGRQPAVFASETAQLEVDNSHLFEIEIAFENGQKALLSKFQPQLQGALLPLARQLLRQP